MIGLDEARARVHRLLWGEELAAASPPRRALVNLLRMVYAIGRDLAEGQLTLRAMSLVYTTLLSLVPLLALSFSVLKGFGVHNQIRPMLLAVLAPFGNEGSHIADQIIGFVENIRVGVLGAIGLGLLIYTVTALLQKIEQDLNHVWRVQRARPFAQRFSQYLSVLTVGPVLVFSALGITATALGSQAVRALMEVEPFGSAIAIAARLMPYLLVIAAFAFVYLLIPNTRVRWRSALAGAIVGGVLWQSLGWGFATFVAGSAKYTAIYAGFAIVILTMIWLYLNWLIVLIGASVAFYHQYPEHLASPRREPRLSNRLKERLALSIMTAIGERFHRGEPAWTLEALAQHLGLPAAPVEAVLQTLLRSGFLSETGDEPPLLLPARAFETTTVKELLDAVRSADEGLNFSPDGLPGDPRVEALLAEIDGAVGEALRGRVLRELLRTGSEGDSGA